MLRISKYIKPFLPLLLLAVLTLFFQAFCDLSLPNYMSQLVNMILRINGPNSGDFISSGIPFLGLMMLAVTLAGGGAAVLVSFLSTRIAAGIARDLRYAVFRKVESFSSREFDHFSTASLITRCTNDINHVQGIFVMGIRMTCYAPIMGIGGVAMAVNKAPSMSWIIVLAVIVLLCLIVLFISMIMPKFKIIQQLIDKLNRIARETLNGLMVIRAFSAQDHEKKRFDEVNKELTKTNLFINRMMVLQMPIMQFIMNGAIVLIIWNGALRIASFSMEVGDMMAFIQYTMHIMFSFLFLSMMFVMLPRASVSAGRIADVLDKEISIKDSANVSNAEKTSGARRNGRIEFKNVSFKYEGAAEQALSNISFIAEQGKTTAIIGATGSGKTTIANLILRFYDVTDGNVLIDNTDVRELAQKDLRSRIGYVPQKSVLLSGPVSFNLKYGKKDASEDEVREGVEISQIADFLEQSKQPEQPAQNQPAQPNQPALNQPAQPEPEAAEGLYLAQGGANISGGQKQRLSIARALIRNPDILIFDDSFSALDFATDAKLRQALEEKRKDTTKLIIAQCIGTIMQADKIIVLENGVISGMGTHDELMRNCNEYREIAESQFSQDAAQSAAQSAAGAGV